MSLREEMHSLGQEIIGSYEARVAGLSALRAATQAQLQECDRAHEAMACQQRAHLNKERAHLTQTEAQRSSGVNAWIKDVAAAHQTMAQQLRTDLTQAEARRSSAVNAWIRDVAAAHQAMAQQQRDHLAQSEAQRSSAVNAWIKDVAAAHQTMAQQLRTDLTQAEARRSSQVKTWVGRIAASRAAAGAEWQRMEATLQAKRAQGSVTKPPRAKAPAHQVGQVTPEFASLRSRAFEYLANRPDGTRLTELEQALAVSRIQMAGVVRSLMEEGKAEKRGPLYFAI